MRLGKGKHLPKTVYFFGCENGGSGHYLFDNMGKHVRHDTNLCPWRPEDLDTKLAPGGNQGRAYAGAEQQKEGQALIHNKVGADDQIWTVLSFWDRSVDQRPASNSAFIAQGEWTGKEMIELFKTFYPNTFRRFTFTIEVMNEVQPRAVEKVD